MALLLAVTLAVGCRGEPRAEDVGPRRVRVLFLGHGSEHHDSGRYAPMLAAALGQDGIDVFYTEDPGALNPDNLARYDALIVYANHDSITADQEEALLDYVDSGHGFLPIHSASYCFRNSDAYVELVGAQFLEHGTGRFTATIVDGDHPVMEGMEEFETWDETYVHHRHNPDRTVLMVREGAEREPWTWVRTRGRGRVFYTAYGHDERTWGHPAFQRLIRNGILWAVGDEARSRLAALELAPLRYAESEVPIPNYEERDPPPRFQEPLPPEESAKHWQIPPGMEIRLFASEPMIVNPIDMAWDARSRLWVLESVDYPNNKQPDGEGNDALWILEDRDGDLRADTAKLFADGLSIPTGLVFARGGVIVSQAPDFLFLEDTDGDDRADVRETIVTGWSTYDTHAGPSNLRYGPDNWIWGTVGYAGFEGTVGGEEMQFRQGVYRFRPDGSELERITDFTNNTWGLGFTESFDVFGSTANNEHSVFVAIPNRHYEGVRGLSGDGRKKIDGHYALHPITPNIRQVDSQGGFTAAAGHSFYTARSFPEEYWNRIALVNEPTGNLLHRAVLEKDGSGYAEKDGWNLMASADEWASPIAAEVGPDGAVWVLDWYNFIIQHNPTPEGFERGEGNAYETPLRDRRHGRIYRISWEGAEPSAPRSLDPDRPGRLLDALESDNMFWRITAQRLLVERGMTDVQRRLYDLVRDRSVDRIGLNAPAIHALWTLHGLGALDGSHGEAEEVVRGALRHPSPGVRKNAARVLPRTPDNLEAILSAGLLTDDDPNVRLHAFLVVSEMEASQAVGRRLYEVGQREEVLADEWLPTALFIAAARHREGFLSAYAEDLGGVEFARTAAALARGELDRSVDWSGPALDDSDWETIPVPSLWRDTPMGSFTGVLWVRRAFELPPEAEGMGARLRLARVNDTDVTYVNGIRIGATEDAPDDRREYRVPPGLLRRGRDVLAVRLGNRVGRGGIWGEPDSVVLEGGSFRVPLSGEWRYRVAQVWEGGRRPDIVAGAPFARQFLRHYNPVTEGTGAGEAGEGGAPGEGAGAVDATLTLGVVPGEIRYDRTELAVEAGARVRLTFGNAGDLPHNVVILTRESAVEELGPVLDAYVGRADAAANDYLPEEIPLVARTEMASAGQTVTVTFTAPDEPGEYPFVCTFPGHWRTMSGVLRVEG